MKKQLVLLLLALVLSAYSFAGEPVKLQSPDKQLELSFELRDGVPYYALYRANKPIVLPSKMGFTLEWRDDLAHAFVLKDKAYSTFDETWEPVWGEEATIRNHYNELLVTLEQPIGSGMDEVVGPLGYSDLEREGLLIDGFEYPATFEETYNYPYYQTFIEGLGYQKDVDWTGSRIRIPKDYDGEIDKMADFVMKRYNLHLGTARNTNDFIKKYADGIFELLDKSYELLYGTVPFTEGMKKMMIDNFRLVIDIKNVAVIFDENEKMVCFGLAFPAIGDAVRPSGGKLTPATLIRLLKALKKPSVIDLCLIGVDPAWLNRGVSVIVSAGLMKMLKEVDYAETNMNLEENYAIQNQWKRFDEQKIKRHRCYVKKLMQP